MAARGGTLRIVAGELRSRRIRIPAQIRPTTDRVRAAIFDALGAAPLARVLDCFAGSGGLGLEALSRGAGHARFIEKSPRAATVIRANLSTLALSDVGEVVVADALRTDLAAGGPFGLVLADPPYAQAPWPDLFSRLSRDGVLQPGAMIVAEYSVRTSTPDAPHGWTLWKTRIHGDTAFTIFRVLDSAGAQR